MLCLLSSDSPIDKFCTCGAAYGNPVSLAYPITMHTAIYSTRTFIHTSIYSSIKNCISPSHEVSMNYLHQNIETYIKHFYFTSSEQVTNIKSYIAALFLYWCPYWQSCPANAIQISWTVIKKHCPIIKLLLLHSNTYRKICMVH